MIARQLAKIPAMTPRDNLLASFKLTPADLEANRMGHLGDGQKRRILNSGTWTLVGFIGLTLALWAIFYLVARRPFVPVQWVLVGGLSAIMLVAGARNFHQTRQAVADDRVEAHVGTVRCVRRRNQGWFVLVNGRDFALPIRPVGIAEDVPYRVVVSPRTKGVVSMEPA